MINKPEHEYIECNCGGCDHVTRITWWKDAKQPLDDTLYIETRLTHFMPWYKRTWVWLQYITGIDTQRIQYTEHMVDHDEAQKMINILQKYVDRRDLDE